MLKNILQEFENSQTFLSLNQLSHKLKVEPSALQGMLEHLVQIGKLEKEISGADCETVCSQCAHTDCSLLNAAQPQYRWKLKQ